LIRATTDVVASTLSLLDWKRTIAVLYADIRAASDKHLAWRRWRDTRERMFREHPESPVPASERAGYSGPHLFDYDPSWRLLGSVEAVDPKRFELTTSTQSTMAFSRFGVARFAHGEDEFGLELYWLEGYGGGLFAPFADSTSGSETYGAGRYLLDTVKGADLGTDDGRLVLDFNFAYQPSCAYDPSWTCPLAPPANRLAVPVRAGERVGPP
jgi:uncharacterized protein (DUF1684 family)